MEVVYKDESYRLMGACFEVYAQLGCGFLEAVYQESLELELRWLEIPFIARSQLEVQYKGVMLTQKFIADFECFSKIILEIKAVSDLTNAHRAQVHNYLSASKHRLGILVNFGHYPKLEYERIVR